MIAKVNIQTAKRNYAPGEVIEEMLSVADMVFLEKHNFILQESEEISEKDYAGINMETSINIPETCNGEKEGKGGAGYKDEADLRKLNKDEIVAYAKSIGLSIAPDMLKNDMIDAVLNYIGEKVAGME